MQLIGIPSRLNVMTNFAIKCTAEPLDYKV